jgi:hypothetical protein
MSDGLENSLDFPEFEFEEFVDEPVLVLTLLFREEVILICF